MFHGLLDRLLVIDLAFLLPLSHAEHAALVHFATQMYQTYKLPCHLILGMMRSGHLDHIWDLCPSSEGLAAVVRFGNAWS